MHWRRVVQFYIVFRGPGEGHGGERNVGHTDNVAGKAGQPSWPPYALGSTHLKTAMWNLPGVECVEATK